MVKSCHGAAPSSLLCGLARLLWLDPSFGVISRCLCVYTYIPIDKKTCGFGRLLLLAVLKGLCRLWRPTDATNTSIPKQTAAYEDDMAPRTSMTFATFLLRNHGPERLQHRSEAGGVAIRSLRVLSWKRTERVFSCERGSRPALYGCFAWLPHAMVLPLLLLVTKITTCCSTREGVVSDTLAVLQLLPSLALYYSRKHSFTSIRSISFRNILFPHRRLNAF